MKINLGTVKIRVSAPGALIKFLSFLPECLLDTGAYLIFRKLRNVIIFCMKVFSNQLLSHQISPGVYWMWVLKRCWELIRIFTVI